MNGRCLFYLSTFTTALRYKGIYIEVVVAKLCPTLANSWDLACQVPLSTGFPGKNTRVDCRVFL